MEHEFGCHLPKEMHPEFSREVQVVSDSSGDELSPNQIWEIFAETYLRAKTPYGFVSFATPPAHGSDSSFQGILTVQRNGELVELTGWGNGPIDACRNALLRAEVRPFRIAHYSEHGRSAGSDAEAVAFIQIETGDGEHYWGVGIHPNIELASIRAIISAVNRAAR